jgi:hypothetical protein
MQALTRRSKRRPKPPSQRPADACLPNTSRCSSRSSVSRWYPTAFSTSSSIIRSTRRRSSASSANRRKPPPPRSASSSRRSRANSAGPRSCRGRRARSNNAASTPCACCVKCPPSPSSLSSMPPAKSGCECRGWPWTWSPAAPTSPTIPSSRKRWRARSITARSISAANPSRT